MSNIYRLENYKGKGPFSGSQGIVLQLTPHKDPESMLPLKGIGKEEFEKATTEGAIFGWRDEELMRKFFKNADKSSKLASRLKMKISVYDVDNYVEFPDGQVMFNRPDKIKERIPLKQFLESKVTTPYYTGVGSRKTPDDIIKKFRYIGKMLAQSGFILRSGGADGADMAFEQGCDKVAGGKDIYLPWKGFNGNMSSHNNPSPEAFLLASELHPNWIRLKESVKRLHARNCHQVLGQSLHTPSAFTVCWTPDGAETEGQLTSATGGTSTAIRLSVRKGIPVFNLKNELSIERFKAFLNDKYNIHLGERK